MERALLSLQPSDIQDLIATENGAEVFCEFCRNSFVFNRQALIDLLETMEKQEN